MIKKEKENDFGKKLLATFTVEAREHINALSLGFLALEKASTADKQREIVEAIFREAHSLKGAARAVNRTDIETLCQALESALAGLKRQEIAPTPELFDELHQAVDTVGTLLNGTEAESAAVEKSRVPEPSQRIHSILKGVLPSPQRRPGEKREVERLLAPPPGIDAPVGEGKLVLAETVRISTGKLNSLFLQAEELVSAKLIVGQRTAELQELKATLGAWIREWAKIQPHLRVLQQSGEKQRQGKAAAPWPNGHGKKNATLIKLLEFLEGNGNTLTALERTLATLTTSADQDQRVVARLVDDHLEEMKSVLMLPFSSLLELFPRMARALARDRGKQVELMIQGAEIEIDRRILEAMKDPLIHLVRNCIDHGIEKPQERAGKNKPPRGRITLSIAQNDSSHVEIRIADDGAGIDVAKVRATAVRLGLHSEEEAEKLAEPEAISLIFTSGVSTSPLLTDISGQGLGLAIVQEKVETLGGVVSVETQRFVGTTFRIVLPLTLATFRGVLVRVDEHLFIFPATQVQRVARVSKEEIKTVENRETIKLNGQAVSLVRLGEALELPRKSDIRGAPEKFPVVLAGSAEKHIAFLVDEVLAEQELLVKSLPAPLARVPNIAGATVQAAERVVPILHVPDLIKSAVRASAAAGKPAAAPLEEREAQGKSVLVVEDSITSRTLLKNILETAGYAVQTAVDGVDAFTQLCTTTFDIVVSDVDMPRMNGFDLTAKIRGDKRWTDLPVVLVTALESREDRERGIDVGADAYIVKSSFDQSNLLEILRRLL